MSNYNIVIVFLSLLLVYFIYKTNKEFGKLLLKNSAILFFCFLIFLLWLLVLTESFEKSIFYPISIIALLIISLKGINCYDKKCALLNPELKNRRVLNPLRLLITLIIAILIFFGFLHYLTYL